MFSQSVKFKGSFTDKSDFSKAGAIGHPIVFVRATKIVFSSAAMSNCLCTELYTPEVLRCQKASKKRITGINKKLLTRWPLAQKNYPFTYKT